MPIEVSLYQKFKTYAVAPEDIQVGEADSVEVVVNHAGKLIKTSLVRKSLTITLRGLIEDQAKRFIRELQNNSSRKLTGATSVEGFQIGLRRLKKLFW